MMCTEAEVVRGGVPVATRRIAVSRVFGVVFLIAACLTLAGCGGDEKTPTESDIERPEDFLPPNGSADMTKVGEANTASTAAELRELINGGYEVYENHGFEEMVQQMYTGTVDGRQVNVEIWIFDMGETENAASLHTELTTQGLWREIDGLGEEAHDKTGIANYVVIFRIGKYWSWLYIGDDTPNAEVKLGLLAAHIEQEIGE